MSVSMSGEPSARISALLEQFKAIKAEIIQRSTAQAAPVQINMTAIGLFAGSTFWHLDWRMLFIIPILSPVLGMVYLDHAAAIRQLGWFSRSEVWPQVCAATNCQIPDFEEYVTHIEKKSRERLFLLGLPTFVVFALIPITALVAPFFTRDWHEIQVMAIPGIVLITLYIFYWIPFVWVGPGSTETHTDLKR
jgi:hypothetical protein